MKALLDNNGFDSKPYIFPQFNKFLYSSWYLVLLFFITTTFWITDLSIVSTSILLLIASFILITNKDITPALPIFVLMVISVSDQNYLENKTNIILMAVMGTILGLSILFNIFYYKQKLLRGKLTIPLLLVSIATFLGGIGYTDAVSYEKSLMYVFTLGIVMFLLYVYMYSCINMPDNIDKKKYIICFMLLFAIIMCIQVITAHARVNDYFENHIRALLNVGWSNRQGLGAMLVITLPAPFYLAETAKKHNYMYYLLSYSVYICLFATFSRCAMLFGTLEIIAIEIYMFIKTKHKKQFILANLTWLLILIIVICINLDLVKLLLDKFTKLGFYSSGRTDLYKEAWQIFLQQPLFGVGLGYNGNNYYVEANCMYWFHSTPLQVLASFGLNGFICYIIYYIARFKVLFTKKNLFTIAIISGVLFFEAQSLIDAFTFQPFPFVFAVLMITTMLELINNNETISVELA